MSKPLSKMMEALAASDMPELDLGKVPAGAETMNWKSSLSTIILIENEMQLLENSKNLEDYAEPPTPPNSPQGILYHFYQMGLQSLNPAPSIETPKMVKQF